VLGKQDDGNYLPFIPAQKVKVEMSFHRNRMIFLDDVFFSIQPSFIFSQGNNAPAEEKTNGYVLVDLSIGGKIRLKSQDVQLIFGVNNLLDKKYVDHLSTLKEVNFFNPGRNFSFSLRVPFEI
jgi:iron complex outermembrane receptor protein